MLVEAVDNPISFEEAIAHVNGAGRGLFRHIKHS